MYWVQPQPLGQPASKTRVERIDAEIGMAQGLAVIGDSLYVVVNGKKGKLVPGLYRLRGSGKGKWIKPELLRQLDYRGEHGPHAIVPAPDGNSLFVACGNMTPPTKFSNSVVSPVVADDSPLARLVGPNPYAVSIPTPGGWIAQVDLDGKDWELYSAGYRNQYDLAFNRDGELFTYDSDMEHDIGTPWYRPTRVLHVTSGSDFGWRSGSGKRKAYDVDTLPAVADIGPGSPTGLEFGYGTKFPPRYQEALYAADWGRGVIQAVHLKPKGASYRSTWESLVRATPLAVTDLAVNPQDGALYFAVGGRGIESAVYRVVYRGEAMAGEIETDREDASEARAMRQKLEAFHIKSADSSGIEFAWRESVNSDRFIRYAARTAIEHQPVELWRERVLLESDSAVQIQGAIALARCGEASDAYAIAGKLAMLHWDKLSNSNRLALLRTYGIVIARHAALPPELARRVADQLLPQFPADDPIVTRELATVLSRVVPEQAVPLILDQFESALTDVDRIHFAHALCDVSTGWNTQTREDYFKGLVELLASHRQHTHRATLEQLSERALASVPEGERSKFAESIENSSQLTVEPLPVRETVREWTMPEVVEILRSGSQKTDLSRGRKLFVEARCADCHAVAGLGGAVGPELSTVASRLSLEDLVRAIVEPNSVISDQYRQTVFEVKGKTLVGRIIDHQAGKLRISTDMTDPKKSEFVMAADIDSQSESPVSPMPTGLLDVLTEEEIGDLFKYLREAR